jgi:hypothetical protein
MHFSARCLGVAGVFVACQMSITAQQLKIRSIPLTQTKMHARVEALYDFHPSTLTKTSRKKAQEIL